MKKTALKKILTLAKIFAVVVVILSLLATFKLLQGGISLGFVTPIAENLLTPAKSNFKVKFDDAKITLVQDVFPLGVKITNFKLLDDENNLMAMVDDVDVSFSLTALLRGSFIPKKTFLYRPYINVFIAKNGKVGIGIGDIDKQSSESPDKGINSSFFVDPKVILSAYDYDLKSLFIVDGQLRISDARHETIWICPGLDLKMQIADDGGIAVGKLHLLQPDGQKADIAIDAALDVGSKEAKLKFKVDNFYLSKGLEAVLFAGAKVSIPLSGNADITFDLVDNPDFNLPRKRVKNIDFSFSGGEGTLVFPKPAIATYDVKEIFLQGYAKDGFTDTKITKIQAKTAIGSYAVGRANIEGLDEVIDANNWDTFKIDLNVEGKDIPLDKLKEYWPPILGPFTHDWVVENLSGGMLTKSSFNVLLAGSNENGLELASVNGQLEVEDTNVRYMETMPVVQGVSGKLFVTKDDVKVKIRKGKSLGLSLYDTELYFYDIWEPQEKTKMKIKVKGALSDALVLLDTEPFNFLENFEFYPKGVKGSADVILDLQFPLRKDLDVKQVEVSAKAKIKDAYIPLYDGYPFENANLDLTLDNKKMLIKGNLMAKGLFADVSWTEVFMGKNIGSTYVFSTNLSNQQRKALGIDFYPVSEDEIDGDIAISSVINVDSHDNMTAKFVADLTKLNIDDGYFRIVKKAGIEGKFTSVLKLKNKKLLSGDFSLKTANAITIAGSVVADKTGIVTKVLFNEFVAGKTKLKVTAKKGKDGVFNILAKGASLDATELFAVDNDNSAEPEKMALSFNLKGDFDKVWLSDKGYVKDLDLDMVMHDGGFVKIVLSAETITNEDIKATLLPTGDGNVRHLSVVTKDGGALFGALGFSSNIKGGDLTITAEAADFGYMSGKLVMEDFTLLQAPVLAQLLGIASLGGILDMLKNDGLSFDIAEIPFDVKPSGVYFKGAHTSGFALGLTAEGSIKKGVWDLEGSVVPVYAVNGFLGKIPLIGMLFSGGEEGGGLLAFKYYIDGPVDNLEVKVNPLSVLAPGVTRQIFRDRDQDTGESDVPVNKKPKDDKNE